MQVQVLGYRSCDFTDDKGNQVIGVSLHCAHESRSEDFNGLESMKVWLSDKLVHNVGFIPQPGSNVNLEYDTDGKRVFLVGYSKVGE